MPILDPTLQSFLLQEFESAKHSKSFFIQHLKTASINLFRNFQTIEASIQFKKDLRNGMDFINKEFGCNFTQDDFENPTIKDYYKYLYDRIDPKFKTKKLKKPMGFYKSFFYSSKSTLYQPAVELPSGHTWFIGSTPVAILVLNENSFAYNAKPENILKIVNLEIDLMAASGFTLVLIISMNPEKPYIQTFLKEMIATHPFAEIHFNYDNREEFDSNVIDSFFTTLLDVYDNISGYFYFYLQFINEKCKIAKSVMKKLKHKSRFHYFYFSKTPCFTFSAVMYRKAKPFVYCKNGFDDDMIRIKLCNVPLYDNIDDEYFLSTEVSGLSFGYISSKDFLNWENQRVKIIYEDKQNNNRHVFRYIDFDDIHVIKPDLYVEQSLFLAKTNEKTVLTVNDMNEKVAEKSEENEEFKKESIFSLFKDKKMLKGLTYVSYAYVKYASTFIKQFKMHDNQIFTALEACRVCIFDQKNKNKGVIYQVETGEGKSCIIQIIAAVLALMKKTVHIASSNITLSNRDYYNSYHFFKQLGLSSAVLLHYNELPYVTFNNSPNDDTVYDKKLFPRKFFSSKLFKNSSNMNFSVCGINNDNELVKDKANVVFSTFVNFECLYLRMMEMCPSYIPTHFQNCSLLIDEADSILIDELTNGTILSTTMKTNGNEILQFVYENKMDGVSAKEIFEQVKEKWPKCVDLAMSDIEDMFREIDLVNQDEFVDGKKYSVETIEVKEKTSIIDMLKNAQESYEDAKEECKEEVKNFFIKKYKKMKEKYKNKHKNKNKHSHKEKRKENEEIEINEDDVVEVEEINNDEDDEEEKQKKKEKEEKEREKRMKKRYKAIIPFDYDHKGVLEPNKEFSGFVQQFIAIKEMLTNEENQDMFIKDVSMNYLYVSHPIFVKLYDAVVGLTGTIGNKNDKKIFKEQYGLSTMKIPRQNPNHRIDYPILLCDDINDRNRKIVNEVIHFNKKENPVLVIFQDLNEISSVLYLLISNGIKNVNIFDGKDDKIKPDIIAGLKGSVSLGTNVCGRGTDIQKPFKPLHVIVTYFTSNERVMYQAFGRTARQGKEGSVRIICLKNHFISPIEQFNKEEMNGVLNDFKFKNDLQVAFIEKYRKNREWIFSGVMKSQKLSKDIIEILRNARININRKTVCNFEFPICMSIPTFLQIQAQKIYSLFNCPNCKYTWMLFQKYIREMILESWSLFIESAEKEYYKEAQTVKYSTFLQKRIKKLYKYLDEYLPDHDDAKSYEIIPTFMFIFMKVLNLYEAKIFSYFPTELTKVYKQAGSKKFCSFSIGFKPYSLIDDSGARINTVDGSDQEHNYITDPELKYMKQQPHGHSILLSITEKIDDIFNWICQKINEVIGSYIGLRFFLRRTLGGCEFGVCFDFDINIEDDKKDFNCLVDQDPLLLFTISVKSMAPILAGILIIGLVYIASLSATIMEWISAFPMKITTKILKKALVDVASLLLENSVDKLCDALCGFFMNVLEKQVDKIEHYKPEMARIFRILMKITTPHDFGTTGDKIGELFEGKVNINLKSSFASAYISEKLPFASFLKIGFLLLLCFSSFMLNFYFHRKSLKYNTSNVAEEYDKNQDTELALKQNQKIVEKNDLGNVEVVDLDLKVVEVEK